jgi:FMN-dependent NADH-azoreductase/putative sterol carrier protein
MRVLAINSSARVGGESKTEFMLEHLVQGMGEAGARVEIINLYEKKINHCIGCFTCWTKTPGKCMHQDDMSREIFPKYLDADLAVLATPLYKYAVNSIMKTFMDRTLPDLLPFFVLENGVTSHPYRCKVPDLVLLSVAGFPEDSVFDQLSAFAHRYYRDKLIAEIYRPAAEILAREAKSGRSQRANDIVEATMQAGHELIHSRKITEETMGRITQPLGDFESLSPLVNVFWKSCIAEGVTPKQFGERGMIPRPDSIETFGAVMEAAFNPQKAADVRAVIQFIFSGQVKGECFFTMQEGTFRSETGRAGRPDMTVYSPFEVWMDIITGKADGQQKFMEEEYRAEGDLSLLMRMGEMFKD